MEPVRQRIYQGSIQPVHFPALPKGWVSEWEKFSGAQGNLQLYGVTHHPEHWAEHPKNPRVLMIFHGLGEHGGRYLHFPHYLQQTVEGVYCLDHRGHGRSEGLRGHVESFDEYSADAACAISRLDEVLKKQFGSSEIHVFGHSMGGLILLRTLFQYSHLPIISASISAPLLGIQMKVPPVKKWLGLVLSRVWGSVHMTSSLDVETLSHDSAVGAAYRADRLCHSKVTPRFFTELEFAMEDTVRDPSGIPYPVQFLVPMQDQIVDSKVTLRFFERLQAKEKLLHTYPDFFHESFNELGKERAFQDLEHWVRRHTKKSPGE